MMPDMMSAGGREAGEPIDLLVAKLREKFGDRAQSVARTQYELAEGESRAVWRLILDRFG